MIRRPVLAKERVAALELPIEKALKKHRAKLRPGAYIEYIGTKDACVCAIGAALLTRVATKAAAMAMEVEVEKFADALEITHPKDVRPWAARVVNEGITEEDLVQLEAGFERWDDSAQETCGVPPDADSPFWQLGVRLAYRALKRDREALLNLHGYVIRTKTDTLRRASLGMTVEELCGVPKRRARSAK